MVKKAKEPTNLFEVLVALVFVICKTIAEGLFFGMGFWWVFDKFVK